MSKKYREKLLRGGEPLKKKRGIEYRTRRNRSARSKGREKLSGKSAGVDGEFTAKEWLIERKNTGKGRVKGFYSGRKGGSEKGQRERKNSMVVSPLPFGRAIPRTEGESRGSTLQNAGKRNVAEISGRIVNQWEGKKSFSIAGRLEMHRTLSEKIGHLMRFARENLILDVQTRTWIRWGRRNERGSFEKETEKHPLSEHARTTEGPATRQSEVRACLAAQSMELSFLSRAQESPPEDCRGCLEEGANGKSLPGRYFCYIL